jgi:hypothetical protein
MPDGRLSLNCKPLLIPALLFAAWDASGGEQGNVEVRIGKAPEAIAVEARQAPLGPILDEIARKTGIRVHYSALPREPVTVRCKEATLKEAITCLLGSGADLMFRYGSGPAKEVSPGRPTELWVLDSSFRDEHPAAPTRNAGQGAGGESAGPQRQARAEQGNGARSEPEDVGKLLEMAGSGDPAVRASAIARLAADAEADERTVSRTLRNALSDEDGDVRAQAVYGLAQRRTADTPAVLKTALQDSDASVRLMAVDSAGTDPDSLAVLREALADSDDTVRALAVLKLEPRENSDTQTE